MTPIRVRAFYTRYPHWGKYSGFQQVCRHMRADVVDVSLHAVSDSDDDWPLPLGPLHPHLVKRVRRRGMAWYKLSDLAAEMRAVPAALMNAVDVVHFLDAEHTGQYLPRWIKRSAVSRVVTVGTFHQPPELLPTLVNPQVVSQLDRVVVVSPSQVPYFRAFLPPDRVQTILHGIDTEFFRPPDSRQGRTAFRCITVGHWMRDWRAVRAVAEAFATVPAVEFHVVTNRSTGLEGLANVHRHADVDDEGLRRLYQEADVLLLPLQNATANNSLLEGIACGLPLVSTRLESVVAYMGDPGAGCLVEPNDHHALIAAVRALHADPAMRARLSAASRMRAEQLSWSRMAAEFERTYADLLATRRR